MVRRRVDRVFGTPQTEVEVLGVWSILVCISDQGISAGPIFILEELVGEINRRMCIGGNGTQGFLSAAIRE